MAELLAAAVKARITTIISGGTGSGKTTLLNALSAFIREKERLITIEDAAELQLQQPHVVRMETRPPNIEGKGEIRQRELVKNALRMRPDRIILGECRGEEAFDMLQAMNTGHEGSMTTIHANNPREAISRLEQMVGMAGLPMTIASVRGQIASAIRMIVQVQRLSDGKRRVTTSPRSPAWKATSSRCRKSSNSSAPTRPMTARSKAISARPACGRAFSMNLPRAASRFPQLLRSQQAAVRAMPFELDPIYVVYLLVALSAGLFVEGVYLLFFNTRSYRKNVNRRLKLLDKQADRESVLVQLRRERG